MNTIDETAVLEKPDTSSHPPAEATAQLQRELTDKGVKYCIGAYVDIHGVPKAKVVPIQPSRPDGQGLRTLHRLRPGRPRPGTQRRRTDLGARSRPRHPVAVGTEDRLDSGRQPFPGQAVRAEHPGRAEEPAGQGRRARLRHEPGHRVRDLPVEAERGWQPVGAGRRRQADQALLRRARLRRQLLLAGQGGHVHQRSGLGPVFLRPRGRQRPVRVRLQLRRCADHLRPADLLPLHGQALRQGGRPARHHDAQALRRQDRQRRPLQHVDLRPRDRQEPVRLRRPRTTRTASA